MSFRAPFTLVSCSSFNTRFMITRKPANIVITMKDFVCLFVGLLILVVGKFQGWFSVCRPITLPAICSIFLQSLHLNSGIVNQNKSPPLLTKSILIHNFQLSSHAILYNIQLRQDSLNKSWNRGLSLIWTSENAAHDSLRSLFCANGETNLLSIRTNEWNIYVNSEYEEEEAGHLYQQNNKVKAKWILNSTINGSRPCLVCYSPYITPFIKVPERARL